MKRTYQSGYQKRKEKKRKSLESVHSSKNLNAWLTGSSSNTESGSEVPHTDSELREPKCGNCEEEVHHLTNNNEEQTEMVTQVSNKKDASPISESGPSLLEPKRLLEDEVQVECDNYEMSVCRNTINNEAQAEMVTQVSNENDSHLGSESTVIDNDKKITLGDIFPRTVEDCELKRKLIKDGPYQPDGPFPKDKDQQNRCFSNSFYTLTTKGGIKLKRNWLCYSKTKDCVYCLPCWLFPQHSYDRVSGNQRFSSTGVRDWKHLSERIASHEGSRDHARSCIVYDEWFKNRTVEDRIGSQYEEERRFWRKVIERILDVTLTLATCNLAFRGSCEKLGSHSKGNFLSIIELLSKYDPILQKLLMRPQGTTKYLSPKIQNELIELLASHVQKDIIQELHSASFFSVIFDTTQDVSKVDQLSEVYRYVKIENDEFGKPKELNICETFSSFIEVKDQTAEGLADEILTTLESKGLSLSKCRGQGYDGASVMSGVYSGVQQRIEEKAPNAFFVHCAAHNLNLVLKDAVSETRDVCQFFETVQSVYCFFGHSIVRWDVLKSSYQSGSSKVTLKPLNPTRWAGRFDAVNALKQRFCEVLKCLSNLALTSKKKKERDEAIQLKKKLESFKFVLLMLMQNKILETINIVSKTLQSEAADLLSAYKLLEGALKKFKEMRGQFEDFFEEAGKICQQWGIKQAFIPKRMAKTKKYFDELCEDERLQDPKSCFKVSVFYPVIDTLCGQLDARFQGMKSVLNIYKIVQPEFILKSTDEDLQNEARKFMKRFPDDISAGFPSQLCSVKTAFKEDLKKVNSVKELADMLIIHYNILASTYPDVCTACLMYLTVPVTVAKAERSFSKLKLIKNYLRNSMGQERLSGLALLSIENDRAKRINIEKIIDDFSSAKVRRQEF